MRTRLPPGVEIDSLAGAQRGGWWLDLNLELWYIVMNKETQLENNIEAQ